MNPCKNLRGYWGVIVGAAISGITPSEASLEGHILIGTVQLLAPLGGQVVGDQVIGGQVVGASRVDARGALRFKVK